MLVKQAKEIARRWVIDEASKLPDFAGPFSAGSANWLTDDATLSATSDLDLRVVLSRSVLPDKRRIILYQGLLLDVSCLLAQEVQSAESILGDYHMASTFSRPNVLVDPSGRLAQLQAVVSRSYASKQWVYKRCEQARDKSLVYSRSWSETAPLHDQVTAWLFATGITTHVLLAAGLKNPTVRHRYLAAWQLLAEYGRLDFYEMLLEVLGCAEMSRASVERHLAALTEAFDAAVRVVKTPFPFASEISDIARPLSIDGSRDLIESGYHREAVFWIVATYSRCRKVLYHDAPLKMQSAFSLGYDELLAELGITSFADLQLRCERLRLFLPRVWEVAVEIIEANPEITA